MYCKLAKPGYQKFFFFFFFFFFVRAWHVRLELQENRHKPKTAFEKSLAPWASIVLSLLIKGCLMVFVGKAYGLRRYWFLGLVYVTSQKNVCGRLWFCDVGYSVTMGSCYVLFKN